MELEFGIAQKNYSLSVQKKNEHYEVKINNEIFNIAAEHVTPNCLLVTDKNSIRRIYIASRNDKTFIYFDGRQHLIDHPIETEMSAYGEDSHLSAADSGICAPMPGKILKILVTENEAVVAKQNLVIVEAMKMEHSVRAPRNGIVTKINFKAGDLVDTGQEILELDFSIDENTKTESN